MWSLFTFTYQICCFLFFFLFCFFFFCFFDNTKYVVGYLISPTKDSAFKFLCLFVYPFIIHEEVFISATDPFSFSFHFGGTKSYNPTSLDAILLLSDDFLVVLMPTYMSMELMIS